MRIVDMHTSSEIYLKTVKFIEQHVLCERRHSEVRPVARQIYKVMVNAGK